MSGSFGGAEDIAPQELARLREAVGQIPVLTTRPPFNEDLHDEEQREAGDESRRVDRDEEEHLSRGEDRRLGEHAVRIDRLSPGQLDRHLQATVRSMQSIDWQMGALLDTFIRLRLYHHLGYRSLAEYVDARLGISQSKARSLARLQGHRVPGGARLAKVYRSGELSWIRALVLLPVLSEQYADAWIERARRVTVRRLIREVRWASDMRDRTRAWIAMEPPELGAPLECSDAEAGRQMRARFDERTAEALTEPSPDLAVTLHFVGPASVMALARDVLAGCSAPFEAPWRAFERMLLHAKQTWGSVARHPNPIHERDGWRCRVPACSARRNLQEHHIVFRSRGGGNERANRVSICAWHHLRAKPSQWLESRKRSQAQRARDPINRLDRLRPAQNPTTGLL
jgi:hypothetical protein